MQKSKDVHPAPENLSHFQRQWFYRGVEGRVQGPLNWMMIEILVHAGVIRPETSVQHGPRKMKAQDSIVLAALF